MNKGTLQFIENYLLDAYFCSQHSAAHQRTDTRKNLCRHLRTHHPDDVDENIAGQCASQGGFVELCIVKRTQRSYHWEFQYAFTIYTSILMASIDYTSTMKSTSHYVPSLHQDQVACIQAEIKQQNPVIHDWMKRLRCDVFGQGYISLNIL